MRIARSFLHGRRGDIGRGRNRSVRRDSRDQHVMEAARAVRRGDARDSPPALAVVLLEPMLWSRIAAGANALALTVHVDGPATDDVVVVTEEAVVAAIVDGRMTAREALSLGLVRLYGSADRVARIRAWLEAIESPAGVTSGDAGMHDWLIRQIAGDARPHLRTNPGVG
jgi:hypothetical protein